MGLHDVLNEKVTVKPNQVHPYTVTLRCDTNRAIELFFELDRDCDFCKKDLFKFLIRVRRVKPMLGDVVVYKFVEARPKDIVDGKLSIIIPICEELCQEATYKLDIFAAECVPVMM
ncbi:hypothetical protein F9B85_12205 [Heliorestis acidaminivorans]|uniref:Uncharacterized protein n=1 Tax=Heliorestis acidaminivorans TaxID=553427 RepID=A0A6I0EY79_9FIRM|nr:hypothetical protein [Heliorestis acidaminivorans]KAB2951559.1 hypothetical protein F9B85_12205 [Heliorestis acidaminivorans]